MTEGRCRKIVIPSLATRPVCVLRGPTALWRFPHPGVTVSDAGSRTVTTSPRPGSLDVYTYSGPVR